MNQIGKPVNALSDYDKAIELEPNYTLAYQNKAWLLATTENKQLRNPKLAVEAALKACELTEYQDISNVAALAAAYASGEEFDKAVGWQEKVIEKTPDPQKPIATKVLQLYQDKKPFDTKAVASWLQESEKNASASPQGNAKNDSVTSKEAKTSAPMKVDSTTKKTLGASGEKESDKPASSTKETVPAAPKKRPL